MKNHYKLGPLLGASTGLIKSFSFAILLLVIFSTRNLTAQSCDYPASASGTFTPGVGIFFGSQVQNPNNARDTDYSGTYANFYQGFGGGFFSKHTLTVNMNSNGKATDQIWIKAGLSSSIFSANIFSGFNIVYYFTDGTTSEVSIGASFASWGINVGGTDVENGVYLPSPGKQFNKVDIFYQSPAAISITGDLAHIYAVKRVPAQPASPQVSGVNTNIPSCGSTSASTTFNIVNPSPELTYKWYDVSSGGSAIFTGTSFSPAKSTQTGTTSYYVEATVANNCPLPTQRTSATRTQVQRTITSCDLNADADGDGITNGNEGYTPTGSSDTDGDGIPDFLDLDSDNDGIVDNIEKGPSATPVDTDGDGIADFRDLDSDNDGINDVREGGGSSTDTNNDGQADGTIQANGIPSSAGANGNTSPRDTDADGQADYKDLDSDNDAISDLQESGNTVALTADANNDGAIDIGTGSDPDKDGIMTAADGTPLTWGDSGDIVPTNSGPNTSDAPDYINTKSDGTSNDISKTPNAVQDANGDGKVDNPADADKDGIADVIDTKPGTFGGLPKVIPAADLTPIILMPQPDFSATNTVRTFTLSIYNVSAISSSGLVTVYVLKPTPNFSIVFSAGPWSSVDSGAYYTLTSIQTVPANFTGAISITGTITKGSGVTKGVYNLQAVIGDGSGSEIDNTNNTANVTLNVNP